MTRWLFLIAALYCIGCSENPSRHPRESAVTGAGGVKFVPPPAKESVETLLLGRTPLSNVPVVVSVVADRGECEVTVKNTGTTALLYYAAGSDKIQLVQEVFQSGSWQLEGWDWCGMGKGTHELKPDETVVLSVQFWNCNKRERMLAQFSEKGGLKAGLVVLAAEPVGTR